MKTITTILLCALFATAKGKTRLFTNVSTEEKPFKDTVQCLMLMSDTALIHKSMYIINVPIGGRSLGQVEQNRFYGVQTFSVLGYQIRDHYWPYHPDYSILNEHLSVKTIGYLDENKKPLSKTVQVWMSQVTPTNAK